MRKRSIKKRSIKGSTISVKEHLRVCEDNYQLQDRRLNGIRLQDTDWARILEVEVRGDSYQWLHWIKAFKIPEYEGGFKNVFRTVNWLNCAISRQIGPSRVEWFRICQLSSVFQYARIDLLHLNAENCFKPIKRRKFTFADLHMDCTCYPSPATSSPRLRHFIGVELVGDFLGVPLSSGNLLKLTYQIVQHNTLHLFFSALLGHFSLTSQIFIGLRRICAILQTVLPTIDKTQSACRKSSPILR